MKIQAIDRFEAERSIARKSALQNHDGRRGGHHGQEDGREVRHGSWSVPGRVQWAVAREDSVSTAPICGGRASASLTQRTLRK